MNSFVLRRRSPLKYFGCGLLALWALAGCRSRKIEESTTVETIRQDAKAAKSSAGQLKNIVVRDWELGGSNAKGQPLWKISARETRIGEGNKLQPRRATLLGAKAELFNNGKVESRFQAGRIEFLSTPQGLRLQMSQDVKAQSSVPKGAAPRAVSQAPVHLLAPRLDVNVQSRRVSAPATVKMWQGEGQQRIEVQAQKLLADTGLSTTTLSGGVKGVAQDTRIEANTATWNWKTNRIAASGAVSAQREGTQLRGNNLQAAIDLGSGVLSGAVQAQNAQGRAQADTVHFDWKNQSISSRGGVTLVGNGGTLKAARIDTDSHLRGARASGGVTVQRGDATVQATSARAFDEFSRVEAIGRVTLRQADLVVTAARVEARNLRAGSALQVTATGGVNARNRQGQVRASRVEWGNGRVVASGGVTLLKDGHTLSGNRLESDQKFANATLSGSVRGTWAAGGTVEAGVLRKNGDKIVATNSVRARYNTLRLKAGRLDSTVAGNNILVSQNVELRSADGATVRAPQLRYDKRQDKVFGAGGVSYTDPRRGLNLKGKTLIVSHVSDQKRREAVLTAVQGSGKQNSLEDLKLF